MSHPKTHLLIDGSNMIHRLFHGLPDGAAVPKHLLRWIALLYKAYSPAEIKIAIDSPGASCWRQRLCPEYKANRSEAPQALKDLMADALDLLKAYQVVASGENEADDLLASWAYELAMRGARAVIVSGDKDLYQCLRSEQVVLLRSFRAYEGQIKNADWFTYARFVERFSIMPPQWPHFRALVGDSSDGLAGVPGIGERTAIELLTKFADVSEIVEAIKTFATVPITERQAKAIKQSYASGQLANWVCVHTLKRNVCPAIALAT